MRGVPNKPSWSSGNPQGPEREAATTGRNGEGDRLQVTDPDATEDRLREAIVDAPEVHRDIFHLGSTVNDNPYLPASTGSGWILHSDAPARADRHASPWSAVFRTRAWRARYLSTVKAVRTKPATFGFLPTFGWRTISSSDT